MMRKTSRVSLILTVILFSPLASAVNLEKGKKLHEQSCTACHVSMTGGDGSLLYTRKNRRVSSLNALKNQVRRCETNLELKWFEEDIENVVQYLNTSYYKFSSAK